MYDMLALELRKKHISQHRLAHHLGISASSLSSRMTGRTPWKLGEAFAVLELLDVSKQMMPEFFGDINQSHKEEV